MIHRYDWIHNLCLCNSVISQQSMWRIIKNVFAELLISKILLLREIMLHWIRWSAIPILIWWIMKRSRKADGYILHCIFQQKYFYEKFFRRQKALYRKFPQISDTVLFFITSSPRQRYSVTNILLPFHTDHFILWS